MDESKIELPAWLPWATTACLAALVACQVELWFIEKERNEFLEQEALMSASTIKASDNQLEAERILNARQLQDLRTRAAPDSGLLVIPLVGSSGGPGASPGSGIVILDPESRRGQLRLWGSFGHAAGKDYQLWVQGPPPDRLASSCSVVDAAADGSAGIPVALTAEFAEGSRFLLIDCPKGGARTLGEAEAGGSIVLASPPFGGKISK
jgi:hypothetical protein